MSEFRTGPKKRLVAEINVVPYLDVMLVLLVVFMVTAPLLTQGVNVDLPQTTSDPLKSQQEEPLIVTVNKKGEYFINIGKSPDQAMTSQVLQNTVTKIVTANPNLPVLVEGDKEVNYEKVMLLMALLQQAGVKQVGLVTEPSV